MMPDLEIEAGDRSALDAIEPLWRALHEHHAAIAIAPVRPLADSWRRRRVKYEDWLRSPDARLIVASRAGRPVGYAMVRVGDGPATWDVGERLAELETLSVVPEERGARVGSALVEAAARFGRERGAERLSVALAQTNDGALRFYQREGFRPFYRVMLRG